ITHPCRKGGGGPGRAGALSLPTPDKFFPRHGIGAGDIIRDLSIGRRQMVEVARAFTVTDDPLRLVILDEPTSSLDSHTAGQLLSFVRRVVAGGASRLPISPLLRGGFRYPPPLVLLRRPPGGAAPTAAAPARAKPATP